MTVLSSLFSVKLDRLNQWHRLGQCTGLRSPDDAIATIHSSRTYGVLLVEAIMATGIKSKFPLDFNAAAWTVEEAAPWVFFGDWCVIQTLNKKSAPVHIANLFIYGTSIDAEKILSRQITQQIENLAMYVKRRLGALNESTPFPPLVWCRLAIQFWLETGGRQQLFLTEYTCWVVNKNSTGPAFVFYDEVDVKSAISKKRKMPLDAFIFGEIEYSFLRSAKWRLSRLTSNTAIQVSPTSNNVANRRQILANSQKKKSREESIGRGVIAAVREWLKQASPENSITKKRSNKVIQFLKILKSDGGKEFKYPGQRSTLYGELQSNFDEEMRVAGYAENGILKAISYLVKRR